MLFIPSLSGKLAAQNIELSGYKVALPEGNVLGVAFDEPKHMFFVQLLVLSTGQDGRTILSGRQVSSWDYKTHMMSGKRMLDTNPRHLDSYLCGRVEVWVKADKVLLCSPEGHLEVLDGRTLNTVGKIAYKNEQYIYDFVIDEERGRVFVLALVGTNRSPYLTSYSLSDGTQQDETKLPPTDGTIMKLILVPKTGKVAVVLDHYIHGPQKSDVYVCQSNGALDCTSVALIARVLQVDVLGDNLLGATDRPADRKNECLVSVDLNTHIVSSHEYCSPATGVHYAVGVADDNYVVGFTGTAKRVWWKEENLSEESSFSIWAAENPKVISVAKEPANFGSNQFGASVFASRTEPLFVAHVGNSTQLYVYSIITSN
jgi:hypothetical protein